METACNVCVSRLSGEESLLNTPIILLSAAIRYDAQVRQRQALSNFTILITPGLGHNGHFSTSKENLGHCINANPSKSQTYDILVIVLQLASQSDAFCVATPEPIYQNKVTPSVQSVNYTLNAAGKPVRRVLCCHT